MQDETKLQVREKARIIANSNIQNILKNLKIDFEENGGILQGICPCSQHNGDRSNSKAWSWKLSSGRWMCWSHHCQEKYGNDIFGLIRSLYNCTFEGSIAKVYHLIDNVDAITINTSYSNTSHKTQLILHGPIQENLLTFLKPEFSFLEKRLFSPNILLRYEAGLWQRPGTYMHNRIIFPIRDINNALVGFTGRTISDEIPKWKHGRYYHRFDKTDCIHTGSLLFNLNKALRFAINNNHTMILVEGVLDGLKLEQAGIFHWVASFGTNFTPQQRTLLIQNNIHNILVAYDNDLNNAGDDGFNRVKRICDGLLNIKKISLPTGKDCGDLSESQLKEIFK